MKRRLTVRLGLLLSIALAAGAPARVEAQTAPRVQVSSGVEPAEVTVGDPFRSVIRVDAPPDLTVEFPDQLGSTGEYESLGPVTLLPGDPGDPHIAIYPMVAWQTGALQGPVVAVHVRAADGVEHVLRVTLPLPTVRSVLPADTAGLAPRGAKPALDEERRLPWWLLAAAVLLLLVLAALLARRIFATRPHAPVRVTERSAREHALAELELVRSMGLLEAADWKPFFSRVSAALRGYLASVSPRWGADLTTEELLDAAAEVGVPFDQHARLTAVLRHADLVKFARLEPDRDDAQRAWSEARRLVEEVGPERDAPVAVGEGS